MPESICSAFRLLSHFNVGNRPLASFRILTVYLTLAALLFGNVAGWVHVGCSSHQSGCCAAHCNSSALPHDESHCHAHAGHTHDHGEQGYSDHGCCDHAHTGANEHQTTCQSDVNVILAESESDQPSEPHDSDRCSICQSFFASRYAIFLWDTTVQLEPLTASRDVAIAENAFVPQAICHLHRVRGPPSV